MALKKTLPTFYYLDHFREFLAFFDGDNHALLTDDAREFIKTFRQSNQALQAMIVRIANRKHPVIALKTLQYEELDDVDGLLDTLRQWQWITHIGHAPAKLLAQTLPKADLFDLLVKMAKPLPPKSINKADLQTYFETQCQDETHPEFADTPFIFRNFDTIIRFLLFLYFGHLRGKLNQFSMRDLGVMRTRADAVTGEARFDTAEDAFHAFQYALNRESLKEKGLSEPPSIESLPPVSSLEGVRLKNKWLYDLGRYFLNEHRDFALKALALSECDEAQEKWLRETYKDGDKDVVEKRLLDIIESASSETLLLFAEDFYARKYKKKRTSALTDMLRDATRCLPIDSRYNQQVEQGVVAYYSRKGIFALRTENQLWRGLFGLTFWPVLYEQDSANLSNEFDRIPPALKHNQLYQLHSEAIEDLLTSLVSVDAFMQTLTRNAAANYGKQNAVFMWRTNLLEQLKQFLELAPLDGVINHLRAMCQDYTSLSDGYPDIMVIENNALRFEEIKAPGDKLRRNQLVSLHKLRHHGFDVQITQVEWVRDPNQIYAVVDIETTGGRAEHHRITEIGIVKMQGTKVIDSWQTLLNPQRHIPASITRLTGIDNAMVADAPLFCDIADQLDAFTQDAIFVAHNVNFDLGFIKQEFARLERYYRRPKLCTVQQCRRVFPGLASYSLANLTKHFEIGMDRHHRALSDAKAAAELLKLVLDNEE